MRHTGTVYDLDTGTNATCGGPRVANVSGISVGAYTWNTVYFYPQFNYLYTENAGISSSGTAFTLAPYQTTDQLYSDCP